MRADAVLVLGKELRRHPQRAERELRARAAAAVVAVRSGAGFVATLEARLRGQERSGSAIVVEHLLTLGLDRERIHVESKTRSTREEVMAARELVLAHGIERLLVLTHAYHLPRVRRYMHDAMPYGGWVAQAPEALLQGASERERAWIEAAIPGPQVYEQERWSERLFGAGALALSGLPRNMREGLEVRAGAWLRG